nr:AzlD domain-containing protein [Geodermatophilaceae bacterium]
MPSTGYLAAALASAATITFALRSVPFALLRPVRDSRLVGYLGTHMPAGVMVILVVYLLRDLTLDRRPYGLPEAAALLVTVGLYTW